MGHMTLTMLTWGMVRHHKADSSCSQLVSEKEEKLGTEVGNCEKGSRMRKPVPMPTEEVLLESIRGVQMKEWCGGV